jgi:hypothetical protein
MDTTLSYEYSSNSYELVSILPILLEYYYSTRVLCIVARVGVYERTVYCVHISNSYYVCSTSY